MKHLILSLLVLVGYSTLSHAAQTAASPDVDIQDADLTVTQLIAKYGYPVEEHQVVTSDGYILRVHRIPHGRKTNFTSRKVVFLMHGLLSSSADWIITGTDNALAYILADQGYDVWMGNARGNKLSRRHTIMDPDKDPEFWQFSWHKIGIVDVPAMIDYVLEKTGQEQLYHIGHSQGTTSFYVMTSLRPEYNKKIKIHISLAPVAYMSHVKSPLLKILSVFSGPIDALTSLIGANEFMPSTEFLGMFGDKLCHEDEITQPLCTNPLFAICGFDSKGMNTSIMPVLMAHTPAGASVKQVMHYQQEILSGAFRQYDFGVVVNAKKYGRLSPPDYPLKAITAPIYMMYSHNDWLAAEVDVYRLCNDLGTTCKDKFLVSDKDFNHLDYLFGIEAPELVYKKVVSLIAKN